MSILEEQFGLKLSLLTAGVIGGIVSLTFEHGISSKKALMLLGVGGVTAAYVQPTVEFLFNTPPSIASGVAFLLGLTSMRLLKIILDVLDKLNLSKMVNQYIRNVFRLNQHD